MFIGRAGKGYEAHIAFDLDDPMGRSSCVSCGECAVSCPTGALTFQPAFIKEQVRRVSEDLAKDGVVGEVVPATELSRYPLFSGIPPKFMQFNGAAVVRRQLKTGEMLCKEGEYGSTAFLILSGEFEVFLSTSRGKGPQPRGGWHQRFLWRHSNDDRSDRRAGSSVQPGGSTYRTGAADHDER